MEWSTHTCGGQKTTSGFGSPLPPYEWWGLKAWWQTFLPTVEPSWPPSFVWFWTKRWAQILPSLANSYLSSFCTVCWSEGNLYTSTMTSSALSEGGKCRLSILSSSRFLSCILSLTHTLSGSFGLRSIHSGTDADFVSTNPDLIPLAVGSPFPSSLFH